ncbi:hypothetical protein CTEN210_02977 [Chaetoceros tenuissimus]|uniref:G-protein coupled receptors family 1 profile domain-containing protein n=1 Tax=Chaetoceros tenuissimus TaxID=426638 RepID=A0AAD3H1C3_9STRA|nr:hypothetical protein CTEN210_02977 [Chaetoceros tenuissimus]
MISKSIYAAQIVRCITASISLVASSILSLMIITSEKGFKSPYSRIIWGLSLADILQSLNFLLSPFLSPKENPDSIFSKGSVESCEGTGFFGSIGGTAIPLYTLFLTYYFLRRVKYKVKPEQFAKFEEKLICSLIWIFSIGTNIVALAKGQINATKYGSICMIASRPYDCATNDTKECTRGEKAKLYSVVTLIVPIVISFLCLFAVLGVFTCHVYSIEKHLVSRQKEAETDSEQKPLRVKKVVQEQLDTNREELLAKYKQNNTSKSRISTDASRGKSSNDSEGIGQKFNFILPSSLDDDSPTALQDDHLQKLESEDEKSSNSQKDHPQQPQPQGMALTKAAGLQSILYILAFMLVYSGPVIALFLRFSKKENTDANFWINSLFLPIGGFLNILIYTRPKVKALRELIPELSNLLCFLIVIAFGGECPSLVDLQLWSSDDDHPNNALDDNGNDHEGNHGMTAWMKRVGWYVSENDINIDEEVYKIMRGEVPQRRADEEI